MTLAMGYLGFLYCPNLGFLFLYNGNTRT